MTISIKTLPELSWTGSEGNAVYDNGVLTLRAKTGVDWTNDALGVSLQQDATGLVFPAPSEFALSSRVCVEGPRTTFDAGALAIWIDKDHWAKICFEYSPQGEAMVVSVVTNDFSDDVNSATVADDAVYLRVSRIGPGWAFHHSADGISWKFVRLFRLHTDGGARVGFLAQAPMGGACVAHFADIILAKAAPLNLRDGS